MSNPVFFVASLVDIVSSIVIIYILWKLFYISSLPMAIIYYCLSMILSESKLYSSIRILSDESISTSSSSSYDVLLPYSLDASHLAEFCSHINPLACLSVIDSLSDKFDYSHAAQEAVNRMNALLLQQNISFGTSKCGHDHTLVDDESLRDFRRMPVWLEFKSSWFHIARRIRMVCKI